MRKIISILLLFVFLASFMNVSAQEKTETSGVEDVVDVEQTLDEVITLTQEEVGLTPDKFGYGLKIAIERLRLALSFSKEKRARLALQLADKRLEEAKLMARLNKLEELERTKEEHRKLVQKAKFELETLGEDEGDLDLQNEVESELEEQETKIEDLENVVLIKTKGLTEEQKSRLLELVESFRSENADIKVKVNEKKLEIKAKLKARGVNETKLEEKEAKLEANAERFANHQIDQAQKMFDLASSLIEKASSEKNVTISEKTLEVKADAEEKLNEAKTALTNKEFRKTVELARESKKLSTLTIASIRGLEKELIENKLEKIKESEELREKLREQLKERQEKIKEKLKEQSESLKEKLEELKEQRKENKEEGSSENSSSSSGY